MNKNYYFIQYFINFFNNIEKRYYLIKTYLINQN